MERGRRDGDAARGKLLVTTDHDPVGGSVLFEHVERLARGDSQPATLSDCVVPMTSVAAKDSSTPVHHRTDSIGLGRMTRKKARARRSRHEAKVLAFLFVRDSEAVRSCKVARFALVQLA